MNTTKFGFLQAFLAIAAVIFLMAAGAFLFWFYMQNIAKTPIVPAQTQQPTPTTIVVQDTPPAVSIAPTIPISIAPTPPGAESFNLIRAAMAAKYNKEAADVELTVSKNTGSHATGGVSFAGETGGGWWLAAKSGGSWVIVQDGNGTMDCAVIAPYNFPNTIVPECWDEATQKLVTR